MDLFRVAILECDTPLQEIMEQVGNYSDIFQKYLEEGVSKYAQHSCSRRVKLEVIRCNVIENSEFPDLGSVQCILLTGSKHNAREDPPWIVNLVEYVRKAHQTQTVRLVGICFGHQIIARALGARVGRNSKGWELSVGEVQLTDVGKKLFSTDMLSLHQMHRDAVLQLPKGCQNIGRSPICEIQGLYQPGRVFSMQAHPEFSKFIMQKILDTRFEQNLFDDLQYANGKARNGKHDGALVGVAIWNFLLEP